jgi:hypothetical protein
MKCNRDSPIQSIPNFIPKLRHHTGTTANVAQFPNQRTLSPVHKSSNPQFPISAAQEKTQDTTQAELSLAELLFLKCLA